jgi:hypothetical protein
LIEAMSPEERATLEESIAASQHAMWAPNPGPQAMAYYSQADEVFYGGAAGGGKSSLIIGLALTQHQRSLIIRLESTQLRGMIDDIAKTLGTRDGLNKQDGQWRIPEGLASHPNQLIEFGGVPNPGDEERHQGIPHDLLAFDEATQLPEYIIDYLSTWNRTTTPGLRTRVILTSNPPTPSTSYKQRSAQGAWVMRRYAPWLDPQYKDPYGLGPAAPGELRYYVALNGQDTEWPDPLPFIHRLPDGTAEVIYPKSRTFIPARVTDNPYLNNDANYVAQLQKLPEPLRSAMLYGDFSLALSDKPQQVFPSQWVREATVRWQEQTSNPATRNRSLTALGVDVSRAGQDATIVFKRYGSFYDQPVLIPPEQTRTGPDVALQLLKHRQEGTQMVIDANGVGASVYDHLHKALGFNAPEVQAYVGSTSSNRRDKSNHLGFVNRRSEAYWLLREALDPSASNKYKIAIPPDDELVQELQTITWTEQSGKIKVVPKVDVVKMLGRSPDKLDALVLAHTARDDDTLESPTERQARAREERLADVRPNGWLRHNGRRARWSDRELPYPERW